MTLVLTSARLLELYVDRSPVPDNNNRRDMCAHYWHTEAKFGRGADQEFLTRLKDQKIQKPTARELVGFVFYGHFWPGDER